MNRIKEAHILLGAIALGSTLAVATFYRHAPKARAATVKSDHPPHATHTTQGGSGLGQIPWKWTNSPNLYPLLPLGAQLRHTRYVVSAKLAPYSYRSLPKRGSVKIKRTMLRKELTKGGHSKVLWKTILLGKDLGGAAMLVHGTRIYLARFHPMATGCTLSAFSTINGRQLWKTRLRGMGSIVHSKWYNRVQIGFVRGHPVVYGHEGPGTSYIEMRDAKTGALRSHRRFKLKRPATPLTELLYHEVHRVLQKRSIYRRTITNFLRGHRRTFASCRKARTAILRAIQHINGLPLAGTPHKLKIRLHRKAARSYVIVARR